ncbi:MAG: 4Fe-4S dicluster domain-containing protein [Candidatus Omnitrophota bacterium]|nr:4Fe-4S dicluster domain-containing protein [Candidatus Omnitrophota bacterium]
MSEELKNKAKELLTNKKVDLIIGYQRAADGVLAAPCFIDSQDDAEKLIWDSYCVYNLASYLKDFPAKRKGIVVKVCDLKSITVLLQENQVKREELLIIAASCPGVIDEKRLNPLDQQAQEIVFAGKCKTCKTITPAYYDILINEPQKNDKLSEIGQDEYEPVRKLEAKSIEERFKFWESEFSRCIRCYACRQICPLCYCPKCVAEQITPGYFSKGVNLEGNLSWNITRAMHLAGRCIDCGECERACPVGIPLRDINKKIEKEIKELFKYEAGLSVEQKPLLSCFDKSDPEDFIK